MLSMMILFTPSRRWEDICWGYICPDLRPTSECIEGTVDMFRLYCDAVS